MKIKEENQGETLSQDQNKIGHLRGNPWPSACLIIIANWTFDVVNLQAYPQICQANSCTSCSAIVLPCAKAFKPPKAK